MKRKDKHINKFLHDPLPDPEIPADDAWAGMNDMLDIPGSQAPQKPDELSHILKSIGKFKGLLIGVSAVVLISAVVSLIVLNTETKNQKPTENQSVSLNPRDSVQIKTNRKTPVLQPDTNHSSAATSSSETTPAKAAGSPSLIASKNPVVSENERIELESKHSETPATNSGGPRSGSIRSGGTRSGVTRAGSTSSDAPHSGGTRAGNTRAGSIHTGTTKAGAGVTRTHNLASAPTQGRDSFSSPIVRQNEAASPANRLSAGNAAQETDLSFSLEKNTNAASAQMSVNSLKPLSGHFGSMNNDLTKLVKKPALPNPPQPSAKVRSSLWRDIHFGPEWNISRSIVSTDYMFSNADSVKRPARLAIPGIFVSKSWNRHTATFIFNPLYSYFGDKERVAQHLDTVRISDSTYFVNRYNANFIKSFGMNFSLQYQYRVFSEFSLVGGVSYAKYSSALLFREVEYSTGFIMKEKHLAAKGQDALKSYIRPQQWNVRAGVLFHSPHVLNNRLQFAWMTIFPISNLSLSGFKSAKTPNMQVSLRFLIK